jgi:hypothetical protein
VKRYEELSDEQKVRAIEESFRRVLHAIMCGGLRFNDVSNGNDLQSRVDAAQRESNNDDVRWALLLRLRCGKELRAIARMSAKDAVYVENETVVDLDALEG